MFRLHCYACIKKSERVNSRLFRGVLAAISEVKDIYGTSMVQMLLVVYELRALNRILNYFQTFILCYGPNWSRVLVQYSNVSRG